MAHLFLLDFFFISAESMVEPGSTKRFPMECSFILVGAHGRAGQEWKSCLKKFFNVTPGDGVWVKWGKGVERYKFWVIK